MTLIETVVAMSLLLIVTTLMVSLFIPSMSLFRRQSGKSDVYRGCLLVLDRFRVGLLNSQLETVTVDPSGTAIGWQLVKEGVPFSGVTGDPVMTNDFSLLYHAAGEQKVYSKVYRATLANPGKPAYLALPEFQLALSSSSNRTQVIGRNVVDFKISDKSGDLGLIEPPLSLKVTCEVDTKGRETNDVERFTLSTSVTPRSMRW